MSDAFNGATCTFEWTNGEVRSHEATVVVRPIPGGETSYVARVHRGAPQPLNLPVTFYTEAEYVAFDQQVWERGLLVWGDESADAILTKLSVSNPQPSGWRLGTASFLLL